MVLELTRREQGFDDGYTGAALGQLLERVYVRLREIGIVVDAVTTDNASNMLAAVRDATRKCHVVGVPCYCHTAQLFVKDMLRERPQWEAFLKAMSTKRTVLSHSNGNWRVPEANETRWNSWLRMSTTSS